MQGSRAPSALRLAAVPLAAAGLGGLAGALLGRVPILEAPGYELGLLGAAAAALLGAPAGIAAARRALGRAHPSALGAFARAAAALAALAIGLFAGSAIRAAAFSPCSPAEGLAFLPALALPSALLAAALGVFCGFATGGRRLAGGLLYAALALASIALSLRAAWAGPAAYALDHLLGYWPGPLYDEALRIDERLVLLRLGTVAWTAALVAGAGAILRLSRAPRGRRLALAAPALAAAAVSLLGAAAARVAMAARGDLADAGRVAELLGGHAEGARCDLHYPREKPPDEAERLLRDCELDARAVAGALGIAGPPRVTVFVYRSEEEKRRLVGAGRTSYTKPWLLQVHVNDAPAPHPVLRHELAHALAASFARGPLRVPARALVLVRAGLVEGLAVAVDLPHGEWTVHEWARAMRDLGLMPSPGSLVEPAAFLAAPPARAYAVAGSFLRFLLDRRGPGPVRRVYAGASFESAFGEPLPALEADWSAFLDGVAVPPALRAEAEARFRPESLFARRCAREVAGIEARADEVARAGDARGAAGLWRRAAELAGDPGLLRPAGDLLERAGDRAAAEATYRDALGRAADRGLRAALESALGDLAWLRGDRPGAAGRYRTALGLDPGRAETRLLAAKLAAVADPALGEAAGPWLLQVGDPALALARLARSADPLARYLLGRAALARGAPGAALPLLAGAAASPLPDPALALEARRLAAEAACASGDWPRGIAGLEAIAREAARAADRERAADAAWRCRAERETWGRPVAARSDWPPPPR